MLSQLSAPAFLCTNSVPSESTKAIVHADVQSEASRAYTYMYIRFNTERPRDLGHVANVGPTADLLSSLYRSCWRSQILLLPIWRHSPHLTLIARTSLRSRISSVITPFEPQS